MIPVKDSRVPDGTIMSNWVLYILFRVEIGRIRVTASVMIQSSELLTVVG